MQGRDLRMVQILDRVATPSCLSGLVTPATFLLTHLGAWAPMSVWKLEHRLFVWCELG